MIGEKVSLSNVHEQGELFSWEMHLLSWFLSVSYDQLKLIWLRNIGSTKLTTAKPLSPNSIRTSMGQFNRMVEVRNQENDTYLR